MVRTVFGLVIHAKIARRAICSKSNKIVVVTNLYIWTSIKATTLWFYTFVYIWNFCGFKEASFAVFERMRASLSRFANQRDATIKTFYDILRPRKRRTFY